MEVTKEEIERRFIEYNQLYFGGILKKPRCSTCRNKHFVGIFGYSGFTPDGEVISPSITIDNDIDWDDTTLKDTILHEMIHYYITVTEHRSSGHGCSFRKICKRLYDEYGISVSVGGTYKLFRKCEKKTSTKLSLMVAYIKHIFG